MAVSGIRFFPFFFLWVLVGSLQHVRVNVVSISVPEVLTRDGQR